MSEYEKAISLAEYCCGMARSLSDERMRLFHEQARDQFLRRAVALVSAGKGMAASGVEAAR